jgi:hypothetical protein
MLLAASLAVCVVGAVGETRAGGEVTVSAGIESGDYGAGSDTEARWSSLSYSLGDRFRIRVELRYLELEHGNGLVMTGLGPVGSGSRLRGGRTERGPEAPAPATLPDPAPTDTLSVSGLGDSIVALSARLAGGGVRLYRIDGGVRVKVPTADEREGLGSGEWDWRLGAWGEYRFWSLTGFAGAGWSRVGDTAELEFNDTLDAYAGLESEPLLGGRVLLSSWLEGRDEIVEDTGSRSSLGIGMRTVGRLRFDLELLTGLGGSAQDLSLTLGVSFGTQAPGARRASR